MSWGFTETPGETAYDSTFTTPAGHAGITFVAASGDSGPGSGAEYPAASPEVLAVGGTTLNLDDQGDYLFETAWTSSGGGTSRFEPEPDYQRAVQTTGRRSTPDVAFDGDPDTGVEVYETPLTGGPGTWQTIGGTSLGAPAWAGILAIADQGRALAGKPSLNGPNQTLPTLYALPTATDFHSVPAPPPYSPWGGGLNPIGGFLPFGGIPLARHQHAPRGGNQHAISPGANLVTGLGSPNGPPMIADLVASTVTAPSPSVSPAPVSAPARRLRHGLARHNIPRPHLTEVRRVAPRPVPQWPATGAARFLPRQDAAKETFPARPGPEPPIGASR
jgi:subtilase family serine protease